MFSVQNLPSLLKHAITPSFVYCILLQSLHTLAPSISLPFVLSIAIAQFMDLQEKCEIIHGQFLRQQCSFGTIVKLRQGSGKDRQGMAVKAKGVKALTLA